MKYVLDAGALIAIDRNDVGMARALKLAARQGLEVTTVAPVVGQAWRDGARQAWLARTLKLIRVRSVGLPESQDAGELLATSGMSDVVDALLVMLASPGDQVFTSDVSDIKALLAARRMRSGVVPV